MRVETVEKAREVLENIECGCPCGTIVNLTTRLTSWAYIDFYDDATKLVMACWNCDRIVAEVRIG